MRALERDYGIPFQTTWSLRYRAQRIKDIGVSIYTRIEAAYLAECESQRRKLALEIEITKAKVGADNAVVASAEAYLDEMET